MKTLTILHKGWRANDTLVIDEGGWCMLTYYTHRKTKITTDKKGVLLYQNQRVFSSENDARVYYMLEQPKRARR